MTEEEYEYCMAKLLEKYKGEKYASFLKNINRIYNNMVCREFWYDKLPNNIIDCREKFSIFYVSKFVRGVVYIDKSTFSFTTVEEFFKHFNIKNEPMSNASETPTVINENNIMVQYNRTKNSLEELLKIYKNEECNADTSTDIAFFRGKLAAYESILKVNSKT